MINDIIKGLVLCDDGEKFTVKTHIGNFLCTAKGAFFKSNQNIVSGDYVEISINDDNTGFIINIKERKNYLIRPRIANIDYLIIVISTCYPIPNLLNVDKLTVIAKAKNIVPIVVITKNDLLSGQEVFDIYKRSGIKTFLFDYENNENNNILKSIFKDGIFAFSGNTGVGKSTILNSLFSEFDLKTGEISKKLKRGKHTTRIVNLFDVGNEAYIADTPGFGAVALEMYGIDNKEELKYYFPEFLNHNNNCRFNGCSHTHEPNCKILDLLESNVIEKSRHLNYELMFNELKNIKKYK